MTELNSRFLLVPILVFAILSSTLPSHAAPTYAAGVTVGQWASYTPLNVTYHSTVIPEPQLVKDLNQTVQSTMTIKQLTPPTNVTIQSFSQFKDTTSKTAILNGNLTTGSGNLTYALIAGGLSHPDTIWAKLLAPSINETIPMNYLGTLRAVNVSNFTMPIQTLLGVANSRQEFVWDQMSGILLEAKVLVVLSIGPLGGFVEYTHILVKATNVFYNPNSTPSFRITATSPPSVETGKTATSTLTVTAVNGFTSTVALTDRVPPGLSCSAITPSIVMGSGTASLSCNSADPATYTVSITGASDSTTHTASMTVTVTTASAQTPNAAATIFGLSLVVFYSIIGAVTAIIAASLLALRTKSNTTRETGPSSLHLARSLKGGKAQKLARDRRDGQSQARITKDARAVTED